MKKQLEDCPVGSLVLLCPGCGHAREYEKKLWGEHQRFPTTNRDGRHVVDYSKDHPRIGRTQQRRRMRVHVKECDEMSELPLPRYYWNKEEVEQHVLSTERTKKRYAEMHK